jgi:hypothetical protein
MGNEESKRETDKNKISLPKVKPGVKGGIGYFSLVELAAAFSSQKQGKKRSKV